MVGTHEQRTRARIRSFHQALIRRLITRLSTLGTVGTEELDPTGIRYTPEIAWLTLDGLSREVYPPRQRIDRALELLAGAKTDSPEWVESTLKRIQADIELDTGIDPHLRPENHRSKQAAANAMSALEWVGRIWPEARTEIDEVVQSIQWFRSPCFWSMTAPYAFGAVFMNPLPHWTTPYFLDTLLHESGHLLLMIEESSAPILGNPHDRGLSPLRKDVRPLIGIYHATWVLLRIREGLQRYLDVGGAPFQEDAARLLKDYETRIPAGLRTLREMARLTDHGRRILSRSTLIETDGHGATAHFVAQIHSTSY